MISNMAGMQFDYEFEYLFYFTFFFLWTLIIVPVCAVYYRWQQQSRTLESDSTDESENRDHLTDKNNFLKHKVIQVSILIGVIIWIIFGYKLLKKQMEYAEDDNPFSLLKLDRGATQSEIQRAFRKLSLKYHPDRKGGEINKFVEISQAYATLTDKKTRKNWKQYGNPYGPKVASYGFTLPTWMVKEENSIWVLAAHGLAIITLLIVMVKKLRDFTRNTVLVPEEPSLSETGDEEFWNRLLESLVAKHNRS